MRKYQIAFVVKCTILTSILFIVQHFQISMDNQINFNNAFAIVDPPPDPGGEEGSNNDDYYNLYEIISGDANGGTYFNIGSGQWSYCPSCAYHVNIDEVTVYGYDWSNNVLPYRPELSIISNIWTRSPDVDSWHYWDYGGGPTGTGEWKEEPAQPSSVPFNEKSEEYDCSDGFSYRMGTTENPRDVNDNDFDCSEWAYFIINQANPNLAKEISSSQLTATTADFKNYVSSNGGFRTANPKVGDIVMWTGHIEFVTETSGEKFVMHGFRSPSSNYCPPDHLGKNTQGIIWLEPSYYNINGMGFGTFLGFWTPK